MADVLLLALWPPCLVLQEQSPAFSNEFLAIFLWSVLNSMNGLSHSLQVFHGLTENWIVHKFEKSFSNLFLYARLLGTYYGMAWASVCPSVHKACIHDTDWVGLSIRLSVHKACKHDTDWTVAVRTVKLSTHTTYDKRTNPIDFQGQGSKVKVTGYTLLLNLVNTIQTEPFKLGSSNLVHILLMTRGWHLLISRSGVKGQGHMLHIVVKLCTQYRLNHLS